MLWYIVVLSSCYTCELRVRAVSGSKYQNNVPDPGNNWRANLISGATFASSSVSTVTTSPRRICNVNRVETTRVRFLDEHCCINGSDYVAAHGAEKSSWNVFSLQIASRCFVNWRWKSVRFFENQWETLY